jgi:hypothetical protein
VGAVRVYNGRRIGMKGRHRQSGIIWTRWYPIKVFDNVF